MGMSLDDYENGPRVTVMAYDGQFIAVRGGLTTGHWTDRESRVVGQRLEAEIGGRFVEGILLSTWHRMCATNHATTEVTVAEYFQILLRDDGRTLAQYKADPLVTGQGLEV